MDASFLHVENDVTPMHIGGVSIFEGPPPPFAELRAMVERQARTTRRATARRCASCRSRVGEPVWVDDPHFSLDYHLRHTAVPAPGASEQLRKMAARVFSQHLDRDKPLWELWMVEGLRDGRWALLSKVHHCMVDGVAATDLMSVMFDDDAATRRPRRRRGGRSPSRPASRSSPRTSPRARARPRSAGARRAARAARDAARARRNARGRWPRPRRPCARSHLLADRPDRPAPRAGAGPRCRCATSRRCAPRSAARSTTSC